MTYTNNSNNNNASNADGKSFITVQRYSNTQPEVTNLQPDLETAQQFLNLLDPTATKFCFQVFDDSPTKDRSKAATKYGTLEQLAGYLTAKNQERCGVFVTVCETNGVDRTTSNIVAPRALFVDFDGCLAADFHLPPTCIVHSSATGKGHSYWMLGQRSEDDRENLSSYQERLAAYYNNLNPDHKCDGSVKDLSRVMRLPGFYHHKTDEPWLVTLETVTPESNYSSSDIMQSISALQTVSKARPKTQTPQKDVTVPRKDVPVPQKDVSPRKLAALEEQLKKQCHQMMFAVEGTRNNTLSEVAFIGGRLVVEGLNREDVIKKVWAAAKVTGLAEAEIEGTLLHRLEDGIVSATENTPPKSKHKQLLKLVEEVYGDRLSFDTASETPLLDGAPLEIEAVVLELVNAYDVDVDLAKLSVLVGEVAKRRSVNAVQDYLNSLAQPAENANTIETLTKHALGLSSTLDTVYIRKFLISAVARALDPGCKVDTALVLQGAQGIGKTTFFQALFGKRHFVTIGENANERDDLLVMHRNWCCELGELETVMGRKEQSSMKNFLSRQVDEYRSPYARVPKQYSRSFVLVGSTNTTDFLSDPTGSRRFWVVKAPSKIDLTWVEANRDAIWSEAVALYRAGGQWWLTDEEQAMSSTANKEYETTSPWLELVASWLAREYTAFGGVLYNRNKPITTADVLLSAIGKPAGQWSKKDEMEVSKVMKELGYESIRKMVAGQRVRYWVTTSPNKQEAAQEEELF